jgi:arylamine N-acetyltransferase
MKALRKKYGKKPWFDTPNAAWYRKRLGYSHFMASCVASGMSMQTYNQVQSIRASDLGRTEKSLAIAQTIIDGQIAVSNIMRDRLGLLPNPNNP